MHFAHPCSKGTVASVVLVTKVPFSSFSVSGDIEEKAHCMPWLLGAKLIDSGNGLATLFPAYTQQERRLDSYRCVCLEGVELWQARVGESGQARCLAWLLEPSLSIAWIC